MELPNIYKGDYRLLAILPLILILLSIYYIPQIKLGVDFQGGTLITLSSNHSIDANALQSNLAANGLSATVTTYNTAIGFNTEITIPQNPNLIQAEKLKSEFDTLVPTVSELEVQAYTNESVVPTYHAQLDQLDSIANQMFATANVQPQPFNSTNDLQRQFTAAYSKTYSDYAAQVSQTIDKYASYSSISVQTVSPVLSTQFIQQASDVAVLSAILSMILVFFFFRSIAPSITVLTGAFADVTIALGAMGLFQIPLTLNSFAALLMLIGFSLDTDILLAVRVLQRKGDAREHAYDSMKTGMTMSIMAMVAFVALFILALLTRIPTYYEISAVALAGLVGDIFATWGIDAVILLYYKERLDAKKNSK